MDPYQSRAEQRRQTWGGGRAAANADLIAEERRYWSQASASKRLDAVWEMALEAWSLKRGAEPAPRLQGSPVGVRKRTG